MYSDRKKRGRGRGRGQGRGRRRFKPYASKGIRFPHEVNEAKPKSSGKARNNQRQRRGRSRSNGGRQSNRGSRRNKSRDNVNGRNGNDDNVSSETLEMSLMAYFNKNMPEEEASKRIQKIVTKQHETLDEQLGAYFSKKSSVVEKDDTSESIADVAAGNEASADVTLDDAEKSSGEAEVEEGEAAAAAEGEGEN